MVPEPSSRGGSIRRRSDLLLLLRRVTVIVGVFLSDEEVTVRGEGDDNEL